MHDESIISFRSKSDAADAIASIAKSGVMYALSKPLVSKVVHHATKIDQASDAQVDPTSRRPYDSSKMPTRT